MNMSYSNLSLMSQKFDVTEKNMLNTINVLLNLKIRL